MAGKCGFQSVRQQGVITLQSLLLLFTGGLLVALLLAVFAVSYGYFRHYVADQLAAHARDDATATGLSLSNAIDGTDPVAARSLIDAVFDSGKYLSVEYRNHQRAVIAGRAMTLQPRLAPDWFVALAELPAPAAEAEVVRGWSRLGTVRVVSHPGRAYDDLWRISLGLMAGVLVIGGLGLVALYGLLRILLRPLKALEAQAQVLSQRNFRKRINLRSTRELNRVTEAMNRMADDLGFLFEGQGKLIQHLRRVNNEDAITGRRTGAEFAVFLPGASISDARAWALALVGDMEQRYRSLAAPMDAVVHAGLVPAHAGDNVRELLSTADEALAAARRKGPSGVEVADTGVTHHHDLEAWRNIIANALRTRSLSLWLQPMVAGEGRHLVHHQVFSRIRAPEGDLRAALFVPVAEKLGLIRELDRLLVTEVLAFLENHPDRVLAISLGSNSVADAAFREELLDQLRDAGRLARRLWIGIPEQAISLHRKPAGVLVGALARMDVPVLVDHFGVGGVPFSYLKNLPFHALRIDNSFIHGIDRHDENRFWLESVIGIARSRGVRVFATGVETAAEYSVLCELGIDGAMGYHLGRPYAADD